MTADIAFLDYIVEKVAININDKKEEFLENEKRNLDLEMSRKIEVYDESKIGITLICIVKSGTFISAEVVIKGFFECNCSDDKIMKLCTRNGTAILFPFLRGTIADISRACNIRPIIIPVVNIVKLFDEIEEKSKTSKSSTSTKKQSSKS